MGPGRKTDFAKPARRPAARAAPHVALPSRRICTPVAAARALVWTQWPQRAAVAAAAWWPQRVVRLAQVGRQRCRRRIMTR